MENRDFKPVFVIPHEKERENVEEIVGDDTSIVLITTPGQVCVFFHSFSDNQNAALREREKLQENMLNLEHKKMQSIFSFFTTSSRRLNNY